MKNINLCLVLILALIATPRVAFADQVFTCIGAEGEKTFSYAPCGVVQPLVKTSAKVKSKTAPTLELLDGIDTKIASAKRELIDLKRQYESDLLSANGDTNQLTANFDKASVSLLHRLKDLSGQRAIVVNDSFNSLLQAADTQQY